MLVVDGRAPGRPYLRSGDACAGAGRRATPMPRRRGTGTASRCAGPAPDGDGRLCSVDGAQSEGCGMIALCCSMWTRRPDLGRHYSSRSSRSTGSRRRTPPREQAVIQQRRGGGAIGREVEHAAECHEQGIAVGRPIAAALGAAVGAARAAMPSGLRRIGSIGSNGHSQRPLTVAGLMKVLARNNNPKNARRRRSLHIRGREQRPRWRDTAATG